MKARIVMVVDVGEPTKWMRPSPGTRKRWMPDRRPLDVVLADRLADAVWGVGEYAGHVVESTIEPIDKDTR